MYKNYYITVVLASCSSMMCLAADQAGYTPMSPFITGLQQGIRYISDTHPTQTYIPLEQYNTHTYYDQNRIQVAHVKEFLDEQIRKNCANPEQFDYFVGIADQDWQIIKTDHGFGLVIPDPSTAVAGLGTQLRNLVALHKNNSQAVIPAEPTHTLNIKSLSNLLAQPTSDAKKHELAKYTLAIAKTFVQAEQKETFKNLIEACQAGVASYAIAIRPGTLVAHTISALSSIYPLLSENNDWIKYQKHLDDYVLRSNNIELIQAHIEDLETQLAANKASHATKLLSYLPLAQDPLEQRIQILKEYVQEHERELRMLGAFKRQ